MTYAKLLNEKVQLSINTNKLMCVHNCVIKFSDLFSSMWRYFYSTMHTTHQISILNTHFIRGQYTLSLREAVIQILLIRALLT